MEKDIHYYAIALLSRAAGFSEAKARVIAYASQYVDDATECEPIRVGQNLFDPVRCAHIGLLAYDWSVQKRVYIPFHFIPLEPLRNPTDTFTFVTVPASESGFADCLFKDACLDPDADVRLHRVGIALHTLADTWAHQGFSGRMHAENDVERIAVQTGNQWNHLPWKNIWLDLLPKIGHAQAASFPDQASLTWQYVPWNRKTPVQRTNASEFEAALKHLYRLLSTIKDPAKKKHVIPWENLRGPIRMCLENPANTLESRCKKWQQTYRDLFGSQLGKYDPLAWRAQALKPKGKLQTIKWDSFSPPDFKQLRFARNAGFYSSPWVLFHRAALKQRHYVLERL